MTNPFSSQTFQKKWIALFKPNRAITDFKHIQDVKFYKSKYLPIYFNVGRNLTKGTNYKLTNENGINNKALVIYDVLPHKQHALSSTSTYKILKSQQYQGYLINIEQFQNITEYMQSAFGKNSRNKMRKYYRRLDTCFNISTKMFYGDIDKSEYDELFSYFMALLKKRYSEKQITYNNMLPDEWNFYKDVAFPLILEKKASLFVVYDNASPIAITYNYHTENAVIDAITVFDTDYSKFNLGYINNLKLLEWCFKNSIKTLDFSKGYFDYKERMCNKVYNFEYHIIYNPKSIVSTSIALVYYQFFEFKSFLRKKNINEKFHQLTYKLKNRKAKSTNKVIEITKCKKLPEANTLTKIDIKKDTNYKFLKKTLNDFLYNVEKPIEEINIFKVTNTETSYVFSSNGLIQNVKVID